MSNTQFWDSIVVGPAYQYGANYLLYDASEECLQCDIPMTTRRIRALMPTGLQPAWKAICQGDARRHNDQHIEAVQIWIHRNGRDRGFRLPTTNERGNAGGCQYLKGTGLSSRDLYDAQGNMFHRNSIGLRLGPAIAEWLRGDALPAHRFLEPQVVEESYQRLRTIIDSEGVSALYTSIPWGNGPASLFAGWEWDAQRQGLRAVTRRAAHILARNGPTDPVIPARRAIPGTAQSTTPATGPMRTGPDGDKGRVDLFRTGALNSPRPDSGLPTGDAPGIPGEPTIALVDLRGGRRAAADPADPGDAAEDPTRDAEGHRPGVSTAAEPGRSSA